MANQYQPASTYGADAQGSGAAPSLGVWSSSDVLVVVLFGLLGGAIATSLAEAHYWLQNYSPLKALHTGQLLGLDAFLYTGLGGPLLTTHAIFVGLWRRKPGMILATAAVSMIPAVPIALLMEHLFFGADMGSLVPYVLVYEAVLLVGVAVLGELLLMVVRATGVRNVAVDAIVGLAVAMGGTTYLLLQAILPMYKGNPPGNYGPLDWLLWLVLAAIWAYVASGLIPAAIAAAARRRRSAPGMASAGVPGVPVPGMAPAAYAPGTPLAQAMPAGTPLPEHPRATTSLVLGVLGLVAFPPLAPVAWAIAAGARREVRSYPGRYSESGALTAGFVLGIIGTVLLAVVAIALAIALITLMAVYQAR